MIIHLLKLHLMKTKISIIRFWLCANYIQLFFIFYLIFFCGQISRVIVQTLFNF